MITRFLHTASDQDEKAKQWFKEKITPFLNPGDIFKSDNPKEMLMIRIIMLKFPEWPEVKEYQRTLDLLQYQRTISLQEIVHDPTCTLQSGYIQFEDEEERYTSLLALLASFNIKYEVEHLNRFIKKVFWGEALINYD